MKTIALFEMKVWYIHCNIVVTIVHGVMVDLLITEILFWIRIKFHDQLVHIIWDWTRHASSLKVLDYFQLLLTSLVILIRRAFLDITLCSWVLRHIFLLFLLQNIICIAGLHIISVIFNAVLFDIFEELLKLLDLILVGGHTI